MTTHPSGRAYVRTYERVRRQEHHAFVEAAVVRSGGRVLYSSGPETAPLFLVVEDEHGVVHGVMAYAFWGNKRVTRNRGEDEHRLQIRYGNVNSTAWRSQIHPVGLDPAGLETTLVIGVEPESDVIVALDPLLYDPLPLGISVYWTDEEVAQARSSGWHVFERDNLTGIRRPRRDGGLGLETVVILRPDRLFDLLRLERRAQALGLDPTLRFKTATSVGAGLAAGRNATRLPTRRSAASGSLSSEDLHQLEHDYELPASEILEIIAERSRLAMAVRGGVAEYHAGRALESDPAVAKASVGHQEGPPDFWVTMRSGETVRMEVKNASPRLYSDKTPRVEVQKTRASRGDPLSRYYTPAAFDVIAACMFGPTGRWQFRYRRSELLTRHPEHSDRIAPLQRITADWAMTLGQALRGA